MIEEVRDMPLSFLGMEEKDVVVVEEKVVVEEEEERDVQKNFL